MRRARVVEFAAPRDVHIVDIALPEPRDDEIVVRILYSGISAGTELLAYRGDIDPTLPLDDTIGVLGGSFSYPFRYGYSCVGVVEEGSRGVTAGSLVFVFHPHQDRFVTAASDAVVLPDVDARVATMFPLVETALQVSLDAGPVFGDVVVVVGLGCVGLLTSVLLQRAGARVVGVDTDPTRREAAADLDVEAVAPDGAVERIGDVTGGRGVPMVIEASGDPSALPASLPLLAHEGTALVASWYGTKPVTLALGAEFHRRRLTLRSTQVSTIPARLSSAWTIERRRTYAASLLTELPLKRLATHEFPFDRVADAFALLDGGADAALHVALSYREV